MHDATKEIAMSELKALADFLQPYHDEVMGLERQALDALAKGDTEAYTASMKAKAEKPCRVLSRGLAWAAGSFSRYGRVRG